MSDERINHKIEMPLIAKMVEEILRDILGKETSFLLFIKDPHKENQTAITCNVPDLLRFSESLKQTAGILLATALMQAERKPKESVH